MNIYFNRSYSTLPFSINILKRVWPHGRLHVLCSHAVPSQELQDQADHFVHEPRGEPSDDYIEFILKTCKEHQVQFLLPRKNANLIAKRSEMFKNIGCKPMVIGDYTIYQKLQDKLQSCSEVEAAGIVKSPSQFKVTTYDQYREAIEKIYDQGDEACIKPLRGSGGKGFRKIYRDRSEFEEFLRGSSLSVSSARLDSMLSQLDAFPSMLLGSYLNGKEYSVDCLGFKGELLVAVPRMYLHDREQRLDRVEELIEISRQLCRHWNLSYLFNFQFRMHDGEWHFIEANARAAAGAFRQELTGLHLLPAALELLCGREVSFPMEPKWGTRIRKKVSFSVVHEEPSHQKTHMP